MLSTLYVIVIAILIILIGHFIIKNIIISNDCSVFSTKYNERDSELEKTKRELENEKALLKNLKKNILDNLNNKEEFDDKDTVIDHQIDPETKSFSAEEMMEQLRIHLNSDKGEESGDIKESNRESIGKRMVNEKAQVSRVDDVVKHNEEIANNNAVNANVSLDVNDANIQLNNNPSHQISAYDSLQNSDRLFGASLDDTENNLNSGSSMNQFFKVMSKDLPITQERDYPKNQENKVLKKENTVDPVSNERIYKTKDNQSLSKNNWEYNNEHVLNGGEIFNGISGYDGDDCENYAAL